jgi:hypothetical protein
LRLEVLRLWLRAWGVIFALGALDFLLLPTHTVASLDAAGARLGFAATPPEPGYWVPLAAAYMVLIALFCWEGRPRDLLIAKVASSLFALGWFAFAGLQFPFLVAGVLDGLIAAGTAALLRAERAA